ncbi:MAG: hypothetical protein A2Y79_12945 [Deltaproteobacteria bacterium RBG_13_43_22]|jgi:hypothetical protein|nr:MAG: hypothetical protein A2Y79_12945 [Deltaproteobacteria bacterium RBG_13_43_22]
MEQKTTPSLQEDFLTVRPSWRSYFVFYAAILIFGIGPTLNPDAGINRPFGLAVSIILVFFIFYRRKATYYRITKHEALRESGLWGHTKKNSLPFEGIAGLEVRRGVVHRLLGIGHLQFRSRLAGQPDLWWFGVEDPLGVKKKIESFLPNPNQSE